MVIFHSYVKLPEGIEWSDSEVTTHSIDAKMAICHVD